MVTNTAGAEESAPEAAPEITGAVASLPESASTNPGALGAQQVPRLEITWDCGGCTPNPNVPPLILAEYAAEAESKGYTVSDAETAHLTIVIYRQRPPAARVMFGFMAGRDVLHARLEFRGKATPVSDATAAAMRGMNSVAEGVGRRTLTQMLVAKQDD
ncbi:MAG: hypothetical protein QM686_00080 [Herbaspirillum sp.]